MLRIGSSLGSVLFFSFSFFNTYTFPLPPLPWLEQDDENGKAGAETPSKSDATAATVSQTEQFFFNPKVKPSIQFCHANLITLIINMLSNFVSLTQPLLQNS